MDWCRSHAAAINVAVNTRLADVEPFKVVVGTGAVTLAAAYIYSQLTHRVPLTTRLRKKFFRLVRKLPQVKERVEVEKEKVRHGFQKELLGPAAHLDEFTELPDEGLDRDEIVDLVKTYLGLGSFDWRKGTQSGTVYNGSPELTSLMTEVYGLAAWTNPLHPDTFPGVRKMEAEIVRMACNLFHGGSDSCGTVTSGGTESIVLACKAYRDYAREEMGIQDPVMVVPVTAHAAFDKAAQMLDMGIVHVAVDAETQRVDVRAMRRAISGRTCMLVGSCPQYPHGSIDDIQEIAKLGRKFGIPVHVDACLGGFLVAFMNDAGFKLKPFDFAVEGVTSISADTHKYGYAPKGSSVILYSHPKYRHYQWFTVVDWPGGVYATSNIGGSRAGGIVAACWASLVNYGRQGYVDCTRKVVATTKYIAEQLAAVPGIKIIGVPEVSVVAIGSDAFNIYSLSDAMRSRGWNLNALQFPSCVHLCCTMLHTQDGVADKFVHDVKELTQMIISDPEKHKGGSAAIYGMAQSIPDRGLIDQITWEYLDALYITGAKVPK